MKINQLIHLIRELGFDNNMDIDESSSTYYLLPSGSLQGCWVNVESGEVGANLIDDDGMYSDHCIYDLHDDQDCYDAYVEVIAYVNQTVDPSVSQAIRIQHYAKDFYDILNQTAPGQFNTPTTV
jgi:hypothetical protein